MIKILFFNHEKIGEGAYGVVYRLADLNLIVKIPKQNSLLNSSNLREVAALKKLKGQKNVVQLELFDGKNLGIYLEAYQGTLSDRIKGGLPKNKDEIRRIMAQLLNGLNQLSNKEIYHRDLKPSNILIGKSSDRKDNTVAIADFGLARYGFVENEALVPVGSSSYNLPFTCEVVTLWYRAPEILFLQLKREKDVKELKDRIQGFLNESDEGREILTKIGDIEYLQRMRYKQITSLQSKYKGSNLNKKREIESDIKELEEEYKKGWIEFDQINEEATNFASTNEELSPLIEASKISKVCLYNKSSDIWSLGCIFGEMLTGKALFPGRDERNEFGLQYDALGNINNRGDKIMDLKQIGFSDAREFSPIPQLIGGKTEESKLLRLMLKMDPKDRITVEQALKHPYFQDNYSLEEPTKTLYQKAVDGDKDNLRSEDIKNVDKDRKGHIESLDENVNYSDQALFSALLYYDIYLRYKRTLTEEECSKAITACFNLALLVFDGITVENSPTELMQEILELLDFDLYKSTEYTYLISLLQNLTSSKEYKEDPIDNFDLFTKQVTYQLVQFMKLQEARSFGKEDIVTTFIGMVSQKLGKKYPIIKLMNPSILKMMT